MNVKILYIINYGLIGRDDRESTTVCTGLYLKHKDRCDAVGVFKMNARGDLEPEPNHLNGSLPLRGVDAAAAKDLLSKAPETPQGEKRSVGVYVVSHGPSAIAPKEELLAKSIETLLPQDAKAKLHYVAFVVCRLADGDTEGTFNLNREDATYMMKFTQELHARQMRPVAAGWDVFISAAPHQPKTRDSKNKAVFHHRQVVEDVNTIPGKKFVSIPDTPTYQTVATEGNEYRKKHKHLYQVTKDNKLRVALGTWSTFTGTST